MSAKDGKIRLDQLLLDRGLSATRNKALGMILAGIVRVGERIVTKAGEKFSADVKIEIIKPPHPYVSRGGLKLEKALDHFKIDVSQKVCLDAGSSTGGFTHCLLLRGAAKVYAIDVGYGQLDLSLRNDPRVIVHERCNVRYLTRDQVSESIDIITADVSFISLTKVMENLRQFLKPDGIFIPLIKPQFEAERGQAKKGVVRDPQVREAVVEKIVKFAESLSFKSIGVIESPITGPEGNVEFLAYFRKEDN